MQRNKEAHYSTLAQQGRQSLQPGGGRGAMAVGNRRPAWPQEPTELAAMGDSRRLDQPSPPIRVGPKQRVNTKHQARKTRPFGRLRSAFLMARTLRSGQPLRCAKILQAGFQHRKLRSKHEKRYFFMEEMPQTHLLGVVRPRIGIAPVVRYASRANEQVDRLAEIGHEWGHVRSLQLGGMRSRTPQIP